MRVGRVATGADGDRGEVQAGAVGRDLPAAVGALGGRVAPVSAEALALAGAKPVGVEGEVGIPDEQERIVRGHGCGDVERDGVLEYAILADGKCRHHSVIRFGSELQVS